MTIPIDPPSSNPERQPEKRLSSKDRIWIVTDIYSYWSAFYSWSEEREVFVVGALDLRTKRMGAFEFSIDDARAMLRAGVPAPPWKEPLPFAFEVCRGAHSDTERGRFHVSITPEPLDEDLLDAGPELRMKFAAHAARANARPGMWQRLVAPIALEKRIEDTALGMPGAFSAGDIKKLVGAKVNVSLVLSRLVKAGRLVKMGEKKGTRYAVAPDTRWWFGVDASHDRHEDESAP